MISGMGAPMMPPSMLLNAGAWPQFAMPPVQAMQPTMLGRQPMERSEADMKKMKRKQSNRESAKRSKEKKKQEAEELVVKKGQVADANQTLQQQVREAQARVVALQGTNASLKMEFDKALSRSKQGTDTAAHGEPVMG